MSLYSYQARTPEGEVRAGTIEAPSLDLAVSALQRRSFVIVSLTPAEEKVPWYRREVWRLGGIKLKDIVILSRQLAILFEAKVPIIDSLKILAAESLKPKLRQALGEISTDIQGGFSITQALAKRPDIFSEFYINMVRSGEESGKLEEVFLYLADYLERSYELLSKARNALI
ncbi:MAG: type II secretion system F family protein [Patescibacteria group bacterium]